MYETWAPCTGSPRDSTRGSVSIPRWMVGRWVGSHARLPLFAHDLVLDTPWGRGGRVVCTVRKILGVVAVRFINRSGRGIRETAHGDPCSPGAGLACHLCPARERLLPCQQVLECGDPVSGAGSGSGIADWTSGCALVLAERVPGGTFWVCQAQRTSLHRRGPGSGRRVFETLPGAQCLSAKSVLVQRRQRQAGAIACTVGNRFDDPGVVACVVPRAVIWLLHRGMPTRQDSVGPARSQVARNQNQSWVWCNAGMASR